MKKRFKLQPMLLLAIAAVLLLASTVGSTQAALLYYSDNYVANVEVSNIGVSLVENDEVINYRDYNKDGRWNRPETISTTVLMKDLLGEDTKVIPGKTYEEKIQVANSGAIDSYVRVIIKKYWVDEDGKKVTEKLDPSYIVLKKSSSGKWVKSNDTTDEREIFYYTDILKAPENNEIDITDPVIDGIKINEAVSKEIIRYTNGSTVWYEYKYDGYSFVVGAEVQAIQTHNAVDAIKSAWGVDATITGGKLKVN